MAITESGWGLYNRNVLLYKEIQNIITRNECDTFNLLKRNFVIPKQNNYFQPSVNIIPIEKSHSTSISDIRDPLLSQNICNNKLLSLNNSSGASAMVVGTLIEDQN